MVEERIRLMGEGEWIRYDTILDGTVESTI